MSYDDQARGLRALAQSLMKTQTRVVAVVSGKGGVGKTFVSTSLALCASAGGKRVLLVDADLSLANVDIVLGVRGKHHLGEVLDGKDVSRGARTWTWRHLCLARERRRR